MNKNLQKFRDNAVGITEDGKTILRLKISKKGITEHCPFCGVKHQHGITTKISHRMGHCSNVNLNLEFKNLLGQTFKYLDGYYIDLEDK